jgi:hypothetical protein
MEVIGIVIALALAAFFLLTLVIANQFGSSSETHETKANSHANPSQENPPDTAK